MVVLPEVESPTAFIQTRPFTQRLSTHVLDTSQGTGLLGVVVPVNLEDLPGMPRFGVVLLEMLTGRQAFAGASIPETLASVIKESPDWSRLPAQTPARLKRLVRRCLIKDPRQRLRDIGDARIAIAEILTSWYSRSGSPACSIASALPARAVALAMSSSK